MTCAIVCSMRWNFAKKLIESEKFKIEMPQDHYGYANCGTDADTYIERLKYACNKHALPIIRTHSGPYNPNRLEALKEYSSWCRDLAQSQLLDVLSIGSSQLTQSNFGEDWEGKPNGGGVPVNSEAEYRTIKEEARPMLVRTYSGTKDVPGLAKIHERSLNISWHALSFWWFDELDGRGHNTLLDNLKEHFEAVRWIVITGKPVEPNVPHHFAFRGADDITYIISGYLAAVTCLMDDLEPENDNSPEIIHVVNYSEAVRLATPPIIKDSIKITLSALHEYRMARAMGKIPNMKYDSEVKEREEALYTEAKDSILMMEKAVPNLYTPEGFYKVFVEGFLPVPYLMDQQHKFPKATMWHTALKNGGIRVVDDDGKVIYTTDRYRKIISQMQ